MAPLPVIDSTHRVALNWSCGSAYAVNVLHFRSAIPTADAAELADRLETSAVPHMWRLCASAAKVDSFDITPLDGSTATYHRQISTANAAKWAGQPGGDYAQALSGVITFATDKRGARYRGRMFLPFLSETVVDAGLITATATNETLTAWNTFDANMWGSLSPLDADYKLVIASYKWSEAEDVRQIGVSRTPGVVRRRNNRLKG